MNINLNNYEAYFLDYHEGSLSLDLVKELMEFIALHPELREEFESFEPVGLKDAEGIKYDDKESLKKKVAGINPSNFDEYAIEYVEGILPIASQKKLEEFITRNPDYKKELELFTKTKLVVDTTLVFDDKLSLKKGSRRRAVIYYWSAAASVALIVGIYFMLHQAVNPGKELVTTHAVIDTTHATPVQTSTTNDTNTIQHSIPAASSNNVASSQHKNKLKENIAAKDSAGMTANKKQQNDLVVPVVNAPQPNNPEEKTPVVSNTKKHQDSVTVGMPLIVINTPHPAAIAKKKKEKFLVSVAKATCKGLHDVTGKNIQLEEKYASDTSSIVAYQLDLGKKEIQFPVKE